MATAPVHTHPSYPPLHRSRPVRTGESAVSSWNWVLLAGIAGCLVFWGLMTTLILAVAQG